MQASLTAECLSGDAITQVVDGTFIRAFIRATKSASCCAPACGSRWAPFVGVATDARADAASLR